MVSKKSWLLASIVIVLAFVLTQCTKDPNEDLGVFIEAPCPVPIPEGLVEGRDFSFGYATVPVRHDQPAGKTMKLAVAVFPCRGENPAPDPLVLNTAGPGKSNMDNFFPALASDLGAVLLSTRDVVLIELRGLRYSEHNLICEEVVNAQIEMMTKNLSYQESMDILMEALRASKERFLGEGADLSSFNNLETVSDIDLIMTELGYEQFNLLGSSAGTVVAQHMIRDYPERLRCVILDAGLPINSTILRDMLPNGIERLKLTFKECEEDEACRAAFPNLEERFLARMAELNETPAIIPLQNPETGEEFDYLLNGYRLGTFVFFSMYYTPQIPYVISKVLNGDYSEIAAGVKESFLTGRTFAFGLGNTVFASEAGEYTPGDIDIDPDYRIMKEGLNLSGLGGEFIYEVRNLWEIEQISEERRMFKEKSNVPVLVLNGRYDPVIPPKYDAEMKEYLGNCHIFRFDGVTHSVADNAPECGIPMILEFLGNPSTAPDSSCVQERSMKFITGEAGK